MSRRIHLKEAYQWIKHHKKLAVALAGLVFLFLAYAVWHVKLVPMGT